jgi:hypothetical protein
MIGTPGAPPTVGTVAPRRREFLAAAIGASDTSRRSIRQHRAPTNTRPPHRRQDEPGREPTVEGRRGSSWPKRSALAICAVGTDQAVMAGAIGLASSSTRSAGSARLARQPEPARSTRPRFGAAGPVDAVGRAPRPTRPGQRAPADRPGRPARPVQPGAGRGGAARGGGAAGSTCPPVGAPCAGARSRRGPTHKRSRHIQPGQPCPARSVCPTRRSRSDPRRGWPRPVVAGSLASTPAPQVLPRPERSRHASGGRCDR